jgi:tetratricopeptide (TPR) repeat protein
MTLFQIIMLAASGYFAFKIYEHIQTLKEVNPEEDVSSQETPRTAEAFSTFSPESLIQRADEAFENDDKEKALALLIEANAKDTNNPDTLFKIAYILAQQGNLDDALEYYKEALNVDEENEFVHNAMASIYRQKEEYASAKMHLNASLEIDNTNPVTYYNFGNLLVDMHKNEEAIKMYEQALELQPDFDEVKEELEKLRA